MTCTNEREERARRAPNDVGFIDGFAALEPRFVGSFAGSGCCAPALVALGAVAAPRNGAGATRADLVP